MNEVHPSGIFAGLHFHRVIPNFMCASVLAYVPHSPAWPATVSRRLALARANLAVDYLTHYQIGHGDARTICKAICWKCMEVERAVRS